ncbi:MAG TPA: hypothetical protein VHM20_03325 [Gammaproteobacteria bacterium]|jgi:hypothetical protein|nr:hypothetical protein [Gammaproteobacteria bacterium]
MLYASQLDSKPIPPKKTNPYFEKLLNLLSNEQLEAKVVENLSLQESIVASELKPEYQSVIKQHIIQEILSKTDEKTFMKLANVFLSDQSDLDYSAAYILQLKLRFAKNGGVNKELLLKEEKISRYSYTLIPLQFAVRHGCHKIVAQLIENNAEVPNHLLGWSIGVGTNKETVRVLIENGARHESLRGSDIFPTPKKKNHLKEQSEIIKFLLDKGLDPNKVLNGLVNRDMTNYTDMIFSDEGLVDKLLPHLNSTNLTTCGQISQTIFLIGTQHYPTECPISLKAVSKYLVAAKSKGYLFDNLNDYYGLVNAAKEGNKKLVKVFITHGIDPHSFGYEELEAQSNHRQAYELIKTVLEEIKIAAAKEKCGRMTYGLSGFFGKSIANVLPEDNWAMEDCEAMARENFERCMRDLTTPRPKR